MTSEFTGVFRYFFFDAFGFGGGYRLLRYHSPDVNTPALAVFLFFFALVTVAGFLAARWRRPQDMHSLEEWGLAGRSFGTWVTWFLIGGDTYTAYTVIAVPAALYGAGANGFFALPYAILVYPIMLMLMPRLWQVCHRHGYITLADFVAGRFAFRPLTLAVAFTGILATMPYIALQLVGIRVVVAALGVHGEWPLALAFVILSAYTWSSGLRAPALIAIIKDFMLYIMVLAALIYIPLHLGGYAAMFGSAARLLGTHTPPASILLRPSQYLGYSTLTLGSALALMFYPHNATAVLSASSAQTVRRNAVLLPAYAFLLGLLALLGYAALAAGITTKDTSSAIPLLFLRMFPPAFAGFCLAAIAIGALVPAAIMSIAASNLFTRNLIGPLRRVSLTARQESTMAKFVSLGVKFGALVFVLYLPAPYAIEMQLLGGIWILQLLPSVALALFTRRLNPHALLAGLVSGIAAGSWMVWSLGMKSSVYPIPHVGGMYAAIRALLLNLVVTGVLTAVLPRHSTDHTDPLAYVE